MKTYSFYRKALFTMGAVIIAMIMAQAVMADSYLTGRELLEEGIGYKITCETDEFEMITMLKSTYFIAYVTGITDQSDVLTSLASSEELSVGDICDIVLDYLESNPALLENEAPILVRKAMMEYWYGYER